MQTEDDIFDIDTGDQSCITICEHDEINGCDKCFIVEEKTPFQKVLSILLFPLRFLTYLASLILVILGILITRAPAIFMVFFIVGLLISGIYHVLYFLISFLS